MESNLSPRKVLTATRRAEALRLRVSGRTFAQIGDALGVSRQAANQLVKRAVERAGRSTEERARELVVLQEERLNALLAAVYGQAAEGALPQLDAALKVIDRLNKLFGVEAPSAVRVDQTTRVRPVDTLSEAELLEEARRLGLHVPVFPENRNSAATADL